MDKILSIVWQLPHCQFTAYKLTILDIIDNLSRYLDMNSKSNNPDENQIQVNGNAEIANSQSIEHSKPPTLEAAQFIKFTVESMADVQARLRSSEVLKNVCHYGRCTLYPFVSEIIQKVMNDDIVQSSGCIETSKNIIAAIAILSCENVQRSNPTETNQLQMILNNLLSCLQNKITKISYHNQNGAIQGNQNEIQCEQTIIDHLIYN